MSLQIDVEQTSDKLHRLTISYSGQVIGEYERAEEQTIERKKEEIACALDVLLGVFKRHGAFVVRWEDERKVKSIRVNDVEVGQVPERCWGK